MSLVDVDIALYGIFGANLVFGQGYTKTFPGNVSVSADGFPVGLWFCSMAFDSGKLGHSVP
jgi:hypothetical protein